MLDITTDGIFGIIGAITGIIGLIFSLISARKNRYDVISEFFSQLENSEFIETRRYVYNTPLKEDDPNAAAIVNFFHHWGLMVKKHYLPIWVFDGATGNGMFRLYKKVKPYIDNNRSKNNDEAYGEYFEWLYFEVKRRRFFKHKH